MISLDSTMEDIESSIADAKDNTQPDGSTRNSDTPSLETVYQQALEFIDLTEKLKLAPDRLQKQCDKMQEMGSKLTESIDELKMQAHSVLESSMNASRTDL